MFFKPIIERRPIGDIAGALGLPVKNVRRWLDMDSIPAGYFKRVAAIGLATIDELLDAAEASREAKAA